MSGRGGHAEIVAGTAGLKQPSGPQPGRDHPNAERMASIAAAVPAEPPGTVSVKTCSGHRVTLYESAR